MVPPIRYRTLNITDLNLICDSASPETIKHILLLSRGLVTISIRPVFFKCSQIQSFLNLHSQSLKKINLGFIWDRGIQGTSPHNGIPDFSNFTYLEEITLAGFNLTSTTPDSVSEAVRHISAPKLKKVSIEYHFDYIFYRESFDQTHATWLVKFVQLRHATFPNSCLEQISISLCPKVDLERYCRHTRIPKAWPVEQLAKTCEAVARECPGLKLLYPTPSVSKQAWVLREFFTL